MAYVGENDTGQPWGTFGKDLVWCEELAELWNEFKQHQPWAPVGTKRDVTVPDCRQDLKRKPGRAIDGRGRQTRREMRQ